MKVVHVINDLRSTGGAERLIAELTSVIEPRPTRVITWRTSDVSALNSIPLDRIEVLRVNPLRPKTLGVARQWLKEADVVHAHLFPTLYLVACLPQRKAYTEHNTWNRRRKYPFIRTLERAAYSRFDALIAISDAVACSLTEWLGPYAPPIHVVPNGIDNSRFVVRQRHRKAGAHAIIGMTGSFTPKKDQDTLIRALAQLPATCRLRFAGVGHRLTVVEALGRSLGLSNRIEFLGAVENIPSFLDGLDMYVQSSKWEGFGIAAIEAMASGLPTLASNVPGLSDVIGQPEYLFPAGDHVALTERIGRLLNDPIAYDRAATLSRSRADQFSIEATKRGYEAIYRQTLLGPQSQR